jgi:hypothetical protein
MFKNTSLIQIERLQIFKIGGGAVLLLWDNTFSPFGMNHQKRILVSDISPFVQTFSPLGK